MSNSWTCPYCNRDCTIGDNDIRYLSSREHISNDYGKYESHITVIICPNLNCRNDVISLNIYDFDQYDNKSKKAKYSWHLKPESEAKPFPKYIPEQLRQDYEEACLIKTKSPKASASLSRRCLQGLIRDFWKITKGTLAEEIAELEKNVDSSTWKAIDSVRHVGNIGAHMEKDVNLIIDVEPEEAGLLIWLIETLFEEWYISRHDKEQKMKSLIAVAEKKKAEKKKTVKTINKQ